MVCLIVSCAVVLNATGQFLLNASPRSALRFNPFSMDARIRIAMDALTGRNEIPPGELREMVAAGIILAPADARPLSLMGMIEAQAGNSRLAARFFSAALSMLPTEIQALNHSLVYAVQDGDMQRAVYFLEIIARRWAKTWPDVEPVLPVLMANEAALREIGKRFSTEPIRSLLINSLCRSPDTLRYAYSILLSWHQKGLHGLDPLINRATKRLIAAGRDRDAFLLFRLTRTGVARQMKGFVYNGAFGLPLSGNPFDWRLYRQAGVDMQVIPRPPHATRRHLGGGGGSGKVLALRFLNNPIQFDNVVQLNRLGPGDYRFQVTYSTGELRTPEPLKIAIDCLQNRDRLGSAQFESGDLPMMQTDFAFRVPSHGCAMQRIHILNGNVTESWKNRYRGALYLHEATIHFLGS